MKSVEPRRPMQWRRKRAVAKLLDISISTLNRLIAEGRLKPEIVVSDAPGARAVVWSDEMIAEYQDARIAAAAIRPRSSASQEPRSRRDAG